MNTWSLQRELNRPSFDLARAALHIAQIVAYPRLEVAHYMNRLDELASAAAQVVPGQASVSKRVHQLSTFFAERIGFRGNYEEYGDPRNSFLNDVLDRRLGIPITLSILYTYMAQRIGIPAYGVALPGHFIVGVHDQEAEIWIDPFHGGRQLSLVDCAYLVRSTVGHEGPLEAAWFLPAAPREIIARLLNNLRIIYVRNQKWVKAIAVIEQLRVVQPDMAEHLRDLGLVYYRQRSILRAAQYLDQYLQAAPEAADAQAIREGMQEILEAWVRQN